MSPRLLPEEFKSWPISYQELLPYYLTAEQIMNVTGAYAKGLPFRKNFSIAFALADFRMRRYSFGC